MNTQKYLDLFEYKLRDENNIDSGFWSFKVFEGKEYEAISEVVNRSDLDADSAYTFTVEALEAIKELSKNEAHSRIVPDIYAFLSEIEDLSEYSEAPTYTSELTEWLAKASNYTYLDDILNEYGWQGEQASVSGLTSMAYSRAWEEHYYKVLEVVKGVK